MYKTVRQGENSLQYTILPQQDEGRSGPGAAVSATAGHRRSGGGGASRAGSRKRSILAYVGLFFVCTIITFAVLIPLMVTSDLMPTPTAWFYRNQKAGRDVKVLPAGSGKALTEGHPANVKGTPLRTSVTASPLPVSQTAGESVRDEVATTTTATTTTTTTLSATGDVGGAAGPLWSDALTVTEFQNLYKNDDDSMMEQARRSFEETSFESPTTTTRPTEQRQLLARMRQALTTTTTTTRPAAKNYPKHFSLQKHEKVSEEAKPIQVDTIREDMEKARQNWLEAHWSYVDPYLQWRNYAADDRLVLPLILGVALTVVVLILLTCYLLKRKRMCRLCKKAGSGGGNRNVFVNVEAQDREDHENLLTNENQSEEE